LWTAKNQPDLYLAIDGLGGIKATVHCPRVDKPTWARHWGFAYGTTYEVAKLVSAAQPGRHKLSWTGARLAPEVTLEWRVFISGGGLQKTPVVVGNDVKLLSPPAPTQTLILTVVIGPKAETEGYPQASDAKTHLLAEGRLCDGRPVWLTYCYVQTRTIGAQRRQYTGRAFGSMDEVYKQIETVRVIAPASNSDGSLAFFDMRVERKRQA
jgi:hypothetical protein